MKTRAILLVMASLVAGSAFAQELTDVQLLKLKGHLPGNAVDALDEAAFDADDFQEVLNPVLNCGHPDKADREIAEMDPKVLSELFGLELKRCEYYVEAHKRILDATGKGSWRPGCLSKYPKNHATKVWVSPDSDWSNYHLAPCTDEEMQDLVAAGVWGVNTVTEAREKWDKGSRRDTARRSLTTGTVPGARTPD